MIFKRAFKRFASNFESNDTRSNLAMKKLLDNFDSAVISNPVKLVISKERVKASFIFYTRIANLNYKRMKKKFIDFQHMNAQENYKKNMRVCESV